MLRHVFLVFLLSVSVGASAQEGYVPFRFVLGGSLSYSSTGGSNSDIVLVGSPTNAFSTQNTSTFSINPRFGTQISLRSLIGASFGYSRSRRTFVVSGSPANNVDLINRQTTLGLFWRWTANPANRLQVYLQPNVGYVFGSSEDTFSGTSTSDDQAFSFLSLGTGLGVQYTLSSWLRLLAETTGLRYTSGETNLDDQFTRFDLGITLNSFRLGAELLF